LNKLAEKLSGLRSKAEEVGGQFTMKFSRYSVEDFFYYSIMPLYFSWSAVQ
jgi:hypothetical protein